MCESWGNPGDERTQPLLPQDDSQLCDEPECRYHFVLGQLEPPARTATSSVRLQTRTPHILAHPILERCPSLFAATLVTVLRGRRVPEDPRRGRGCRSSSCSKCSCLFAPSYDSGPRTTCRMRTFAAFLTVYSGCLQLLRTRIEKKPKKKVFLEVRAPSRQALFETRQASTSNFIFYRCSCIRNREIVAFGSIINGIVI